VYSHYSIDLVDLVDYRLSSVENLMIHLCNLLFLTAHFDLQLRLLHGLHFDLRRFEVIQLEGHRHDDLQGTWLDSLMEPQLL
jgi:hypothetical protein